jgi:hypothetical protein
MTWRSSAEAASHGGHASLEYLKAHPGDQAVHVVLVCDAPRCAAPGEEEDVGQKRVGSLVF